MRGYYSLIQYCPDLSRLESVNVGVVLFCPEAKFIEARTAAGNDKPRRMFGDKNIDRERLNAAKSAMETRFRETADTFKDLADLQQFARTRANELLVTDPRSLKVSSPEQDLERLFKELVGGRSRSEPKIQAFPELDTLFDRLVQERRGERDYVIPIPMINRELKIPYAYQNGIFNLVKPQVFSSDEKRATDLAMKLAIEGDLIQRHTKKTKRPSKLIIVSRFETPSLRTEFRDNLVGLFREYNVEAVAPEGVPAFIQKVSQEAHS